MRTGSRAGNVLARYGVFALAACCAGSGALRESLAPVLVNDCTMWPERAAGGFFVHQRYVLTNRSAQTIVAVRVGVQTWARGAKPLAAWDTGFPVDDRRELRPGQREVVDGATGSVPAGGTQPPAPGPFACKLIGVGFSDGTTWRARAGWFGPLETGWIR